MARLVHAFPTSFVVLLTASLLIVVHGGIPSLRTSALAIATVLLSQISVGALNDYVDRVTDARMQPEKPIPSGAIPPKVALGIALAAGAALPVAAAPLGVLPLTLALLGVAGGWGYDLFLKPTPLGVLGYIVGFVSLITFVWLVAGTLTAALLLVIPAGVCLLLAAHLANAYPDIESDAVLGQRGLAVLLGPRRTRFVAVASPALVAVSGGILALARGRADIAGTFAASALIALACALLTRDADARRTLRVWLFRGAAVACGVCALAGVLLVKALST